MMDDGIDAEVPHRNQELSHESENDVDDLPAELEPESGVVKEVVQGTVEENLGIASLVGRPLNEIEKIFIGETLKLAG